MRRIDWYGQGYDLGRAHARPDTNLDPRWTMAAVSREGGKPAFDEFMRGFDDGYDGRPDTRLSAATEEGGQ